MANELPKAYEAKNYEDAIYKRWEDSGFFNPDACVKAKVTKKSADPFTIVLPPPNVTGTLHMGHAAMLAIEDVLIRYHRMKGDKTLWVPGTDHAAVATESKVEKLLIEKGAKKPKEELGREKFLNEVQKFAQASHDTIVNQSKKMGASLDWSREAYTLDDQRNLAVRTVFKKMYDDGLIYRGYRVINWSVKGQSTCSDDELVYVERPGKLYYFKYSKDFPITIATTRPETKLGDTAVAVHPDDKRYAKYVGKTFTVDVGAAKPLTIKIIADAGVEMEKGTGALGVTPAHSVIDFEMYAKQKAAGNDIGLIQVIGEDGKMTAAAGKNYAGLYVNKAREKFVAYLREQGLLEKEEDTMQNVGTSDRFSDVVEPLPKTQWFVDVNKKFVLEHSEIKGVKSGAKVSLKELMQKAVSGGDITIVPDRFDKTYFHWIDNLRDWCISRQIWFGHQIPVWYKRSAGGVQVTFIQHTESEANVKKVGAGHVDSPLTKKGIEQAEALAKQVTEKFDAVFSSDLKRATKTAEIIFGKQFKTDKRLREINMGKAAGQSYEKIDAFLETGFPGGETYQELRERVSLFLSEIMEKYAGKKVAIVAHGGIRRALESIANGKSMTSNLFSAHTDFRPCEFDVREVHCVGVDAPKGAGWVQDADTLDTWFSSGLWTFSTLGWPDAKKWKAEKAFHPTAVLETGYDILFFWVARMILMTTYTLGEVPFKTVYLHGLVRDEQGRKMSKTLGNIIDPLDMIAKYGTDATRLSLLIGSTPGNDVKLSEEKIAGFRNFTNKLWNIARFMLMTIEKPKADVKMPKAKTLSDEWILSKLQTVIAATTTNLDAFNLSYAGEQLRDFTWSDVADWYLEIAKVEGGKSEMLNYILNTILKLWHPYMPFVTETIWQEVYGKDAVLMVTEWPAAKKVKPSKELEQFELLRSIVTGIRSVRAENKIEPAKKIQAVIFAGKQVKLIQANAASISSLARLETLQVLEKGSKPAQAVGFVEKGIEVYVDLGGAVDAGKEKERLTKELAEVSKYIPSLEAKLNNQDFVSRAPAAVIEAEKKKLADAQNKMQKIQEQLSHLK